MGCFSLTLFPNCFLELSAAKKKLSAFCFSHPHLRTVRNNKTNNIVHKKENYGLCKGQYNSLQDALLQDSFVLLWTLKISNLSVESWTIVLPQYFFSTYTSLYMFSHFLCNNLKFHCSVKVSSHVAVLLQIFFFSKGMVRISHWTVFLSILLSPS